MLRSEYLSNALLLPFPSAPYRINTVGEVPSFSTSLPQFIWWLETNTCEDWHWETSRGRDWPPRETEELGRAMRADDVADKIILGFYLARVFPEQQLCRILVRGGVGRQGESAYLDKVT